MSSLARAQSWKPRSAKIWRGWDMVSSKKTTPPAQRPQANERKQRGRTDRSAMFPVAPGTVEMPAGYADWLTDIKTRIHREGLRVVLASNAAMVLLYWD